MSAAVVASRDAGRASSTTTATETAAATAKNDSPAALALCNGKPRQRNEITDKNSGAEGSSQKPLNPQSKLPTPAAAPAAPRATNNSKVDTPLPADVRKILLEVAQTGACAHLSWNDSSAAVLTQAAPALRKQQRHASAHRSTHHLHHAAATGHRRPTPLYAGVSAAPPPRKKHRNGLHNNRQRRFEARKRPLLLIRTTTTATAPSNSSVFSPPGSSVGSGRTSGSEPEDTTSQYECDSEGTSATSNSELSIDRSYGAVRRPRWQQHVAKPPPPPTAMAQTTPAYASLRDLFRVGISLVLEHYYSRTGYTLSPAEKRRIATAASTAVSSSSLSVSAPKSEGRTDAVAANGHGEMKKKSSPDEEVFRQRWKRVLAALEPPDMVPQNNTGPPFTIQRIAEVLLAPERYYTQTHKLCNCLEKLLLVTSSTSAFGGSNGGDTSQSRREEREMAALADEKERLQSQLRHRRLRRRASSSMSDEIAGAEGTDAANTAGLHEGVSDDRKRAASPEKKSLNESRHETSGSTSGGNHATSREMLEAAARASLRTKFDHVGIDPHHAAAGNNRDVRAIADHRGMTNSPPPPSLSMSGAGMSLPGHGGLLRQHHDQDHHGLARSPSPILFNSGESPNSPPGMHGNPSIHLLQVNHAAAVAGLSPFELMSYHSASAHDNTTSMSAATLGMAKDLDLECRSSASSDIDSESDVSFDDSASDRSDGSDCGGQHYNEPFSAARANLLNRMQQQQQRLQTRLRAADMDDSMEDSSGGSDSSDMAD